MLSMRRLAQAFLQVLTPPLPFSSRAPPACIEAGFGVGGSRNSANG